MIDKFTEEEDVPTSRKMEFLADKGLQLIKDKFLDETYLISWQELEKEIKG